MQLLFCKVAEARGAVKGVIDRAPGGPTIFLGLSHQDSVEVRGGAAESVVFPLKHGGQVDHGRRVMNLGGLEGKRKGSFKKVFNGV